LIVFLELTFLSSHVADIPLESGESCDFWRFSIQGKAIINGE